MGILKRLGAVVIPGGAPALGRKYLLGAGLLIMWVLALEAFFMLRAVSPVSVAPWVEPALLTVVCVAWAANAVVAAAAIKRRSGTASAAARDELYRKGLAAFAAGNDEGCRSFLKKLLAADRLDADCLFLAASIALKQGKIARAKRLFRKCRDFDEKGKWSWHINAALEEIAAPRSA